MKNHSCFKSHTSATWRSVSPVCNTCRDIGIGFTLEDGTVIRLRIPIESATNLVECLAEFLDAYRSTSQSDTSGGMPKDSKSIPDGGVIV